MQYPLMATNLLIALRKEVSGGNLLAPRIEDDDDSWKERDFAEDTDGLIGVTWPPRSYSCDFCKRDFRSAQALGGHMNVHRRDRARLRQSFSTHQAQAPDHQRWSSSPPVHQEIASNYDQLPVFNSSSDENSFLCSISTAPNPSMVSMSQLVPSSSTIRSASPLQTNSHIMQQQQQRHEFLPSTVLSISPYSPNSEHTLIPSPPVSNSLITMNISNSLMEISGFDRRHGGFASSMAESASVLRKLQQARAFQPCLFPAVASLRQQNKDSNERDIRINNLQNEETIILDENRYSEEDDGLDLELRLGQMKS